MPNLVLNPLDHSALSSMAREKLSQRLPLANNMSEFTPGKCSRDGNIVEMNREKDLAKICEEIIGLAESQG